MIVSWTNDNKPIQTDKAMGFKIKHNGQQKIMWVPKSKIKNTIKSDSKMADVEDWIYDQKFNELF